MKQYIKNEIYKDDTYIKCVKQEVFAMIETPKGQRIFGSNRINNYVGECPRDIMGCKTGEGYRLCIDTCKQESHAEIDTIKNAQKKGIDLTDSTLTLVGHSYCCDNCKKELHKVGITKIIIL